MLRIIAGEKKGRLLKAPRTRSVRPTAAGVRKVLFDMLGADVVDSRWLDLYAGSGAVGLEALSRGAADCVLVEHARASLVAARSNIKLLGYEDRCEVIESRSERVFYQLKAARRTFDYVFLDPPYHTDDAERCLRALGGEKASDLLAGPECLVIAQIASRLSIPWEYGILAMDRERKVGDTRLCFFRPKHVAQAPDGGAEVSPGAPG